MKVFPEYFDANQFIVPNYNSHFTIKRPYTNFAKSMRLNFEDYFTNLKLQCVIFDKIWQSCLNQFGVKGAVRRHRCFEAQNYFDQCLRINHFVANDKKYFPQRYATSEYFHLTPHHDSVHVEPGRMAVEKLD